MKKEVLRWFFDFVNLDLKALSSGDHMKWTVDAINIVNFGTPNITREMSPLPYQRWQGVEIGTQLLMWQEKDLLSKAQTQLKDTLAGIMKSLEDVRNDLGWKSFEESINFFTLAELESSVLFRLETPWIETEWKAKEGEIAKRITPDTLDDVRLVLNLRAGTDIETLLLRFLNTLDGIELKALKICPECGKYFLHTSNRAREF